MLDEPCAALDLQDQDKVLGFARALAGSARDDGRLFHAYAAACPWRLPPDVLLMTSGSSYVSGPTDEALSSANLTALYDLPIARADFDGLAKHTYAPVFRHEGARFNG